MFQIWATFYTKVRFGQCVNDMGYILGYFGGHWVTLVPLAIGLISKPKLVNIHVSHSIQGCQMVFLNTKNAYFGIFCKVLE
jgi:hypothetical protein